MEEIKLWEDEFVTFEMALRLKRAGFDGMKSNGLEDNMAYQLPEGELRPAYKCNIVAGYVLAPTLSLAAKFLREKHNLFCCPLPIANTGKWGICAGVIVSGDGEDYTLDDNNDYNTYEEAMKAGLCGLLTKFVKYE